MEAIFEDYKAYLDKKQFSDNTVISYMRDLESFSDFCGSVENKKITKVNRKSMDRYIDYMKESGKSNSTIARAITAIRRFYMYLLNREIITSNPVHGVELPHIEKKLPEVISQKDIVKLLNQPKCKNLKGYRDKAILELL